MFKHALLNGVGKGNATLVISGAAVFIHTQQMQSALAEALDACDHLTIDVGGVELLDLSFRALLCSLHRRSELLNKSLSLQGVLPAREGDPVRYTRVRWCLGSETDECCSLFGGLRRNSAQPVDHEAGGGPAAYRRLDRSDIRSRT